MKPSEAARATAEWFTDHPWIQGRNLDPRTGAMCLRGALTHLLVGHAYGMIDVDTHGSTTYSAVVRAVGLRHPGDTITSYNDAPGRTVDEIIHTLKLVTEDLELKGL